ncbi:ThuA domain-containing protein [Amnibacterium sp. CER49]|uniref:ThuA domain-containing protein n=1 Tax=Amnibacterium sp. CER49 TaxID=3039161 RepID=UPI00244837AA|nr:ThuA domain-containing protein [Amnibacterium sp. CER49]MDH2442481.1 ThuA domain-containing protein [Amnibacterium sp. CER49]
MSDELLRARVVSGSGRFADPWHPFAETSAALARIAHERGFDVEVRADVAAAIGGGDPVDLLVLNLGDPAEADAAEDDRVREGLLRHVAARGGLVAVHSTLTGLRMLPDRRSLLGGVWVHGASMHPEYGEAQVRVLPATHPITEGLADFVVDDERYASLDVEPDLVPLLAHEHEGALHPLLWARQVGAARVVADALGHDGASYRSPEHREVLGRAMVWAAGDQAPR